VILTWLQMVLDLPSKCCEILSMDSVLTIVSTSEEVWDRIGVSVSNLWQLSISSFALKLKSSNCHPIT
jgi:hypothetical protein